MDDKVVTAELRDLVNIFDPDVQEPDDAGGARILYVFDEYGTPQRVRVGENFILQVLNPPVSLFVSAPVNEDIREGTIILSEELSGVESKYSLSNIENLVADVSLALGIGDDEALSDLFN